MKLATFRGGPLDRTSRWIPDRDTFRYIMPADLTAMLEASLKLYERGLAEVPPEKIAIYRKADDGYYHMEGYE